MTEAQPAAAPGSAADHDQAFAKPAPPEVPRADLLRDTAQHGRCQAAAAADAAPSALPPVPPPPPHALRTKLQLLQDQLEHVQELKRHYTGFYKACLAHLPALAASLHKSQHALLLNAPAKRAAPDGGAPADDAPPGKAHKAASADAPSSAPAADDGMAASDSKQVTSQTRPDPDALQSFSEAEDEALDAAASTSAASGGRGGGAAAPALAAWQGALAGSLAALGDQERMAAVAAAVEMDARNACAVLCGRRKRFYLHQTVTLLGRESKSKGEVDINVSLENSASKVSRLQCLLEMDHVCGYVLRNIGRQTVVVSNTSVATGSKVKLPHLSVIEVGAVQLLFVINVLALQRACLQPPPCPKEFIGL